MDARGDKEADEARTGPQLPRHDDEGEASKHEIDTGTSTPNGFNSSPPALVRGGPKASEAAGSPAEDAGLKSDSEAETIVLPGKDGHSPSKRRQSIKHENKSEDEAMRDSPGVDIGTGREEKISGETMREAAAKVVASMLGKRKRSKHGNMDDAAHLGNSSGLSSVPTSPVATARSSLSKAAASESGSSRSPSPRPTVRDKAKSVDRVFARRLHNASGSEDDGESEPRRIGRQRSSGADSKPGKDARSSSSKQESTSRKRTRSISPTSRGHRRSASSQLPSKSSNGLSHKKKRVPAPLQSTEYHSDESSASAGSHPQSSRFRHLAAPTTGDSNISPAKMAPHKKHVNSSGQTLLARACASGRLETAKQRLEERPEDLNVADNALNTPLHVASIDGHTEIVKLLLDAGCIVDCVNVNKDTPLHDAVDNGHVEVVRLLLNASANPRKPNNEGEEPLGLVDDGHGTAVASEMRRLIIAAKKKSSDVQRDSEDPQLHENADSRLSHPSDSPRHTPPGHDQASGFTGRKVGTTRSMKTSDRLLYQSVDLGTLRKAASKGDWETVTRILQVNTHNGDRKTLILAAKGGHAQVINMLLGLGEYDPDPDPVPELTSGMDTPMLAAIGRHSNTDVIKLFLDQDSFNPTREFDGQTYYELARSRKGPAWKEEEALLKEAYMKKQNKKTSPKKTRSPGLRRDGRDDGRREKPSPRDNQHSPRTHKRTASSPKMKEIEVERKSHKRKSSQHSPESPGSVKRGPGRPRKEESASSAVFSESEAAPLGPPKQKALPRKSESDVAAASSENEAPAKPIRRKLLTSKEYKGDQEMKQRRASIASNTSTASFKDRRERLPDSKADTSPGTKSPTSPRLSKKPGPKPSEHDHSGHKINSEKDRARSIKRDDSKDRLSAIRGESPVKRPRNSETPPRLGMHEVTTGYSSEGPQKRRKLENDTSSGNRAETTSSSSPDHQAAKPGGSKEKNGTSSTGTKPKLSSASNQKHHGEPEDASKGLRGLPASKTQRSASGSSQPAKPASSVSEAPVKRSSDEDASLAKKRTHEEREARIQREVKEAEAVKVREQEEKLERERIEQAKQAREAREEAARKEEAKRQQEEAERRERQKQEDAEAHARAVEEQRILYQEQERLKREEVERRRAIALEQQRAERARVEEEKRLERLSKLPLLLKWFDMADEVKTPEIASLFRYIEGYRYDTIKPEATGQPNGREQWMLNTQVAILLGEKDLQLSRYTAWERIPLTIGAKRAVWRTENTQYSLAHQKLSALRQSFLDSGEPFYKSIEKDKLLFLDLDLFFVKVSEFMFVVPNFQHLRGIELVVNYRELQETPTLTPQPGKWKQDPDHDPSQIFAPRPKYYVNGQFVRQGEVLRTRTSTQSFGERRVPRRGLVQVLPGEPDYEEICRKQGLFHLLPSYQAPISNHVTSVASMHGPAQTNGMTPPSSDMSKSINGGTPRRGSSSEAPHGTALPNGVNGIVDSPREDAVMTAAI